MPAVQMPGSDVLPPGPRRELTAALHDLYKRAGLLGTRVLSAAIRDCDECPDTVSHEGVASILRGHALPAWPKVESLVRVLAIRAVDRPDPDATIRSIHAMWLDAMQSAGRQENPDPQSPSVRPGRNARGPGIAPALRDLRYAIDIALCVDVTASMQPIIEEVKTGAFAVHAQLKAELLRRKRRVGQLRIRVIAYRDFSDRAEDALRASPFYVMPDQVHAFETFVRSFSASGGGYEPDSGLEALSVAIGSDWEQRLDNRRHLIVVFTDASARPLGGPERSLAQYPATVPESLSHLRSQWGARSGSGSVMENSAKRLLLFAPDAYPWNLIAREWDNVIWFVPEAGAGLAEFDMRQILDALSSGI